MTVTIKNLVPAVAVATAQTTQYTANNCTTVVDKCTVTNTGATALVISINIVASGGTVGVGNSITHTKAIAVNESYTCPEMVGQVLPPGAFISTLASAAGLTIAISGREIT